MRLTRTRLKQIIKEEFEAATKEADMGSDLVNAVLDMQQTRGNEYTVKILRELADDIERESNQQGVR
tara:strand:+ start:1805 stop:2005 length:201 start_codon:yes stop_codon:yes gene_type:complete